MDNKDERMKSVADRISYWQMVHEDAEPESNVKAYAAERMGYWTGVLEAMAR